MLEPVSDLDQSMSTGEAVEAAADPMIVVVLPTLNEKEGVGVVLEDIERALLGRRFEVLVVDGGSTDGTVELARLKGAHVIFQRGRGYGDALIGGFRHAVQAMDADVLVMMDADASYDSGDIPSVVSPIVEGEADMVVGNRFPRMERGAMAWLNRFGNEILSWFARGALRLEVFDTQSGFKAFSSELYSCMDLSSEGMPLSTQVLGEARRARAKIVEVPVAYRLRVGKRKLDPLRDGLNIFTTILLLARDYRPMAFFGGLGVVLALLGSGVGLSVVAEFLETGEIRRQASVTLSALLVLTGVQVFVLGLVADMVKSLRKRRRLH